nr:E-selectin-like [Lytechinus pictus]
MARSSPPVSSLQQLSRPYLPTEFGTGQYEFTYVARDSAPSRNTNICKVRFKVEVKTCSVLEHPHNGFHDCPRITEYLVIGTTCRYSCKEGYKLQGPSQQECDGTVATLSWTPMQAPICQRITCGPLAHPLHGSVSCTLGDEYFSICSYSCEQGYGFEPGVVSNLVCLSYGWSGLPPTECTESYTE